MALKQNTIVYLETGSGKTLIATMLLRSFAHQIRKPSPYIAVFLVPQAVLVSQVCHQSHQMKGSLVLADYTISVAESFVSFSYLS